MSDPGAAFDREVTLDVGEIAPMVTWGNSPEDALAITGRVPDPAAAPNAERREAMLRAQPELGLWYAMKFGLSADGRVMPNFEYDLRPSIGGEPALLAEAQADLARAPRPERWVPKWLA